MAKKNISRKKPLYTLVFITNIGSVKKIALDYGNTQFTKLSLSFQADKKNLFCTFDSFLAKLGRNQVDSTFYSAQMVHKLL